MVKKSVKKVEHKHIEAKKAVKSNRPLGVKIISILVYINAAFLLLSGILYIVYGIMGKEINVAEQVATSGALIVAGVLFLVLSFLIYLVGRGLWNGKNWSRILMVVVSALSVITAIYTLAIGGALWDAIVGILLNGAIGGYLWFSGEAKRFY